MDDLRCRPVKLLVGQLHFHLQHNLADSAGKRLLQRIQLKLAIILPEFRINGRFQFSV